MADKEVKKVDKKEAKKETKKEKIPQWLLDKLGGRGWSEQKILKHMENMSLEQKNKEREGRQTPLYK